MTFVGAHFRKADLQIHSPRDEKWDGERPEAALRKKHDASSEEISAVRREWARSFLRACADRRLKAIAITDHHEGVYVWDIIAANASLIKEGEDLDVWIFPGMELSTKDAAQAIILFDADIPPALFSKARNLLRLPSSVDENSNCGVPVDAIGFNIEGLQEVLAADEELRDRFIILPNVTPGGHKTVLRSGFHKRFREMPYVGGYLDGQYPDDLKQRDRQILDGEIPAWGSRRRGVISTSDSRSADFSKLGDHCTWIKLAAPTAESLRQAMLAADSRIRYGEHLPPNIFIQAVEIEGATFLDVGTVEFNPQYNAIIGGRGAGKSTLLEFIRFALGQSALDFSQSEWDPTFDRRREILEQALTADSGAVRLTVNMNGALIQLKRSRKNRDQISLDSGGIQSSLSSTEVRALIPVQTFSQGELSHLGQEKAETRLLELVIAPNRDEFDAVEENIENAATELTKQLSRRVTAWSLEQKRRLADAELQTAEARFSALQGELNTTDPEAQAVVAAHPNYEATDEFFRLAEEYVDDESKSTLTALDRLLARIAHVQGLRGNLPSLEADIVLRSLGDLTHRLERARKYISEAQRRYHTALQIAGEAWDTVLASEKLRYQQALEKLSDHQVVADQIQFLGNSIVESKATLEDLAGQLRDLSDADTMFATAVSEHQEWQRRRVELTRIAADTIKTLSQGLAKAEVARVGDLQPIHDALVALFQGTSVRDARLHDFVDQIKRAGDPLAHWWAFLGEIVAILAWKVTGRKEIEARPRVPILEGAIDTGGLNRLCERISVERVSEALKTELPPRLVITHERNGRSVEFRKASQGERAATLLTILMNQSGGPLLIDQPEEDLDNRIINEIIGAIRGAKDQRQLIFATHNANLVVNGDAEYVMDLSIGKIASSGAIDQQDVRDAITATMEGGKDAFELRRRKYNF